MKGSIKDVKYGNHKITKRAQYLLLKCYFFNDLNDANMVFSVKSVKAPHFFMKI